MFENPPFNPVLTIDDSEWDNKVFVNEEFKMSILRSVKEYRNHEEQKAEQKLRKAMSTLMGLELRAILSNSIENLLSFFEQFSENSSLSQKCFLEEQKHKFKNANTKSLFRVDLIVESGGLQFSDSAKVLADQINSFFLMLTKCFFMVQSPEDAQIQVVKNVFEKINSGNDSEDYVTDPANDNLPTDIIFRESFLLDKYFSWLHRHSFEITALYHCNIFP